MILKFMSNKKKLREKSLKNKSREGEEFVLENIKTWSS